MRLLVAIFLFVFHCAFPGQGFDVHSPSDSPYDLDTLVDSSLLFPLANISPIPRVHHSMVMNSKFLIVYGGYSKNGTILGDTNFYHIPTQTWSGPIKKEECCNDQTEIVDVIGVQRTFQFPYLKTGQEGDYPLPRAEHAACVVNETMYIFGGVTTDYHYMNDLYSFDTSHLQWSPLYTTAGTDSIPRRRAGHSMLGYNGKYMFLFGGRSSIDGREIRLNDLWKFDISLKYWVLADKISSIKPDGRQYAASTLMKDHLYVFGGVDPVSSLLHHDLWSFSIASGLWSQLYEGSSKAMYEFAPPPLIHAHLIPVSTSQSDGLLVYGGLGSGGACIGADNFCRQHQVSFGQVYLYSLKGETWLQPFQQNDFEISKTTLQSNWLFARLTNGTKGLTDPSNSRYSKLTKSYSMEKIVFNSIRKTFYEFGGVHAMDSYIQSNNQEVSDNFPQSQDIGGFSESEFSDTQSGEQLRDRVTSPVNGMWTYTNEYEHSANLTFDNSLRLFTVSSTDVVLIKEYN